MARTVQQSRGGIRISFGRWEVGAPDYREGKLGSACGSRQVRAGANLRESLTGWLRQSQNTRPKEVIHDPQAAEGRVRSDNA